MLNQQRNGYVYELHTVVLQVLIVFIYLHVFSNWKMAKLGLHMVMYIKLNNTLFLKSKTDSHYIYLKNINMYIFVVFNNTNSKF